MVKIVDHAYEPETTIRSNQAKIKKALAKKEKVVVLHSEGFVHGRLAGIPGVEYKVDKALPKRKDLAEKANTPSAETQSLLQLWGVPVYGKLGVRPPKWQAHRIAFIHWMPCGKELQPIEIFHLNMLWAFNAADFFDEIHIRIAGDGKVPEYVSNALKEVLGGGTAKLDIRGSVNSDTWEWNTYREFLAAAREDADMYYLHFKGTSHAPGSGRNTATAFYDYGDFKGIAFWSYLMYQALFTIAPTEAKPAVCGILHENPVWAGKIGWDVHSYHASGSFQAYSGKALLARKEKMSSMLARAKQELKYMRYTVEGMMTFLFVEQEIGRLCYTIQRNTAMYTDLHKVFPQWYDMFRKGPEYSICRR